MTPTVWDPRQSLAINARPLTCRRLHHAATPRRKGRATTMPIIVVGLNHTTGPIEWRERLHFPADALEGALETLALYTEGGERVILSTCNRVEIYGHVQHPAHGSS